MLAGVKIEHEPDERATQPGAPTREQRKPRTRDPGAAVEIERGRPASRIPRPAGRRRLSAGGPDLPVRWHGVRPRITPLGDDGALAFPSGRHAIVGQIGDPEKTFPHLPLRPGQLLIEGPDALGDPLHGLDLGRRVLASLAGLADRLRCRVPPCLERLDLRDQPTPFPVGREHPLHLGREPGVAPLLEPGERALGVLPERLQIEHGAAITIRSCRASRARAPGLRSSGCSASGRSSCPRRGRRPVPRAWRTGCR